MEEVKRRRKKSAEAESDQVNLTDVGLEPANGAEDVETADARMKDMTIEETFAALDALIDQLESGKGSLEDAFKNYEEGMKLVKSCNEKIEKIEKQILVLNGEPMGDGEYV